MTLPRPISSASPQVPLRWVLVVPFVLQIFAAVGLTGYLSIRNGQQAVNEVTQQLRSEVSSRIQERLDSYLESPHLVNALTAKAIRRFNLWNVEDMSAMEGYVAEQLIQFPNLSYLGFGGEEQEFAGAGRNNDGSLVTYLTDRSTNFVNTVYEVDAEGNPGEFIEEKPNYNPTIRPWYRIAIEANQAVWTNIYLTSEKRPVFSAVEPFYDSQGILRGVLVVDLSLWHISEFLRELKIGKTGQAFIIERNGFLVASSNPEQPPVNEEGEPQRLPASESRNELIRFSVASLKDEFSRLEAITETRQLKFTMNDRPQLLQVTPVTDDRGLDCLIVAMMGSEIQVKSTFGAGSTFWFDVDFPVSTEWVSSATVSEQGKIIGYLGEPKKILVVDDRPVNRSVVAEVLKPLGFSIDEAENGEEGLEHLQDFQPDLVITDIVMPILDGYEFARQIRTHHSKELPILAASASVSLADQSLAIAAGCNDFLEKPLDLQTLLIRLQNYLQLSWIYEETQSAPETPVEDLNIPSESEVALLYQATKIGDIEAIEERVQHLKEQDSIYDVFCDRILALANEFDDEGILKFLDSVGCLQN
ncbi:MAG: response regulator [Roseofilum sp. SID1]|uniref:response regulator n=1 Tax=unclassified Roseofilum TaxID=2620099 RepID=UPI001B0F4F45|nr:MULTISPECIES: response regulator [unclassified Roseofilum]MBP0039938.1 response regulator [Roseofilum sp. SID1]